MATVRSYLPCVFSFAFLQSNCRMCSPGPWSGTSCSRSGMSKFSVLRVVMVVACLAVVSMLGTRGSALADLQPIVRSAQIDRWISDTNTCPCFSLEDLQVVQWSAQAAEGPNCKAGSPLWSIASPPTGIVNAASVHTGLSTCVLMIEFGPAAGAFSADLHLTADEQQRCIEIIEVAQSALDCQP